jgi:predicted nucleic acid-binding protein
VIFVDTSVWVAALRRRDSPEAAALDVLLDADDVALAAPVRFEILSGASNADRGRLRRVLSALPTFYPTDRTWSLLDEWREAAARAGERFGFVDCLIAALAAEQSAPVWSLDRDFGRMARLAFVKAYRP